MTPASERHAKALRILRMHRDEAKTRLIAAHMKITERHVLQIPDACRLVGLEAPKEEAVA